MPESPHLLDYASTPHARRSTFWSYSAISLTLCVFVTPMFTCACGHLNTAALPVTGTSAALACIGWLRSGARLPWRAIQVAVSILALMQVAKNAGDVLWFGHEPLW